MGTAKEIKGRIRSIKNTQKITRAMEMIAASKLKKARERMEMAKPYAHLAQQVISQVANAHPEYKHPYLAQPKDLKEVQRVGFIIISTDRGLCGGLNINLFKLALKEFKFFNDQKIKIDLALIGQKSQNFFKRLAGSPDDPASHIQICSYAHHLGDKPTVMQLIGSVKTMLDHYDQGKIGRVYLISNEFVSTIKQKPYCQQILPIIPKPDEKLSHHWDYIYEPDAKSLLNLLLTRYLESQVYSSVVENIACEQASKMLAMRNATDSARDVIKSLQLEYNKARQAMITKELAEICSGADAIGN